MYDLDKEKLPRHVGVIMDGNGRWAKTRGLPRAAGHRAGTERLKGIVRLCSDIGIEVLTVYAFSTENWKRPQAEVDTLLSLLREYFEKEIDELNENNVRIRILGSLTNLPEGVRDLMRSAMYKTEKNDGLQFNIAFNYGGRAEIVRAVRLLATEVRDGVLDPDDVDEAAVMSKLYTAGQPDADFVIRTSGEARLSNFLLMQASYAELYFTKTYWPDFSDEEFISALRDFGARERRYGGV